MEWLGEVPAHWEMRRLKTWLDINKLVLPEDTHLEYTFDYLDIGSAATGRLAAKTRADSIRKLTISGTTRRQVRRYDRQYGEDLSEGCLACPTPGCRSDCINRFRSTVSPTRNVPEIRELCLPR